LLILLPKKPSLTTMTAKSIFSRKVKKVK